MSILAEAEQLTRGDRQHDYGHPADCWGEIARHWSIEFGTDITAEQACRAMIYVKMVRQKHRPKRDNYLDAAGYADCAQRIRDREAKHGTTEGQ